jgi:hypothetical protein
MDFRNILHSLNSLSEGDVSHKGTYGTSYGKEDVRDQYGHKIGKVDKDAESKKEAPKRGRGRPTKGDKDEHGHDAKFDTSGLQGMLGKKPSKEVGKTSKKHSLKEYIDEVESNQQLDEAEQVTIAPAQQNTQVIKQGDKVLGSVTNPQLAAQIKNAIGQGQMSLAPGEDMQEGSVEESGLQAYLGNKKYGKDGMNALRKAGQDHASEKKMQNIRAKYSSKEDMVAESIQLTEGELKQTMLKFFDELSMGPKGYNISAAVDANDKGLASSIINKTLAHGRFKSMSGTFKDQLRDAALEHFGFTNYNESLEEADLVPHPSKDMYRQHAIQHGVDTKVGDPNAFKPSRIQTPSRPVEEPTPWSRDPIAAASDRAINFISGLGKPKSKLESTEMKDVQLEGWEKELNNLLNEGITVSTSTGQQGAPDSVSINATDNDANELLNILRQSGMGVFGGNDKPTMTPYGVVSQGEEEPTGTGTEPEMSPEVVGGGEDMLSLLKKMSGLSAGPVGQEPKGTASSDYEDEDEVDEGMMGGAAGAGIGALVGGPLGAMAGGAIGSELTKEDDVDEGNAFSGAVAKAKQDGIQPGEKINVGGKEYPVKEDDMEEGNKFTGNLAKARAQGKKEADLDGDGDMEKVKEGHDHEMCNECGGMMYEGHTCEEEQVEEGFSNDAGGDAMANTELANLKALLSMGNDLHKMKRDQTVLNPTQVTMRESIKESLNQWKRLSGLK